MDFVFDRCVPFGRVVKEGLQIPFPSSNFAQIPSSHSTFHCVLFVNPSPSDPNSIFPVKKKKKKKRQIPVPILPLHAPVSGLSRPLFTANHSRSSYMCLQLAALFVLCAIFRKKLVNRSNSSNDSTLRYKDYLQRFAYSQVQCHLHQTFYLVCRVLVFYQ